MFGRYYVLAKVIIDRVSSETKHVNVEIKRIAAEGIVLPEEVDRKRAKSSKTGTEVSVKVKTIEAYVDHPEFSGKFALYSTDVEGLRAAKARKKVLGKTKANLQFHVRATEYAYMKHGEGKYPSWVTEKFEDHKVKKTVWQRLGFSTIESTDADGNTTSEDVAIRYRTKEISARVAESSLSSKDKVVKKPETQTNV